MDEPVEEGQGPKINGSVMMYEADSEEEVWKAVKSDIYYTSGVWDAEKVSWERACRRSGKVLTMR